MVLCRLYFGLSSKSDAKGHQIRANLSMVRSLDYNYWRWGSGLIRSLRWEIKFWCHLHVLFSQDLNNR